ncbi:MAG: hypothetical protein DI537_19200 [Stutzerimonas stutzeri]|nr:MAG: hypothetical protein DI537_19200 [Stutzerimonas stutzeri]
MSFDIIERSNYDGQPIRLYEFNIGSVFWRYTSDEVETVLPGSPPLVFAPQPISDSGAIQSGDGQANDLTLTLPSDAAISQMFALSPPSEELWITIREKHVGSDQAPVVWVGTVASSKRVGLRTMQFTCQILTATFERNGLRLSWGRQCPHALYDRNCKVDKSLYGLAMTITTVQGNVIYANGLPFYPDNWFSNGFFEFSILPGVIERRGIEQNVQVGGYMIVLGTGEGITVGMVAILYPGCSRTTPQCSGKFNNLSNFGGFPHLPGKSPFGGDPVF